MDAGITFVFDSIEFYVKAEALAKYPELASCEASLKNSRKLPK